MVDIKHGSFESYRRCYDLMSFDDIRHITEEITIGSKTCYHSDILDILGTIVQDKGRVRVLELGCGRAQLAMEALRKFPILQLATWIGYDLNKRSGEYLLNTDPYNNGAVAIRFAFNLLRDYFYNLESLPPFNVFICSHVFEHMRHWQIAAIIQRIVLSAKYIIIEIPDLSGDWKGCPSPHVLEIKNNELRNTINRFGYECIFDKLSKKPSYWVTCWRRD